MRMWVQFQALLGGLRILHCTAVVQDQSLTWELPHHMPQRSLKRVKAELFGGVCVCVCVCVCVRVFVFYFLGLHLWHMEVPRLRVESELHLPAYTTASSSATSELHLRPTPKLVTMDPEPTD